MRTITGETIFNARLNRGDPSDEAIEFKNCWFQACGVDVDAADHAHVRVSNVHLRSCRVSGGGLRGVHLIDCSVRGLQVSSAPSIIGCVLEHVTLAGKINKLIVRPEMRGWDNEAALLAAAAEAYQRIDWALDISELDCPDLSLKGVPPHLLRLDPATQSVISREDLERTQAWREVDYTGTHIEFSIGRIVREGWPTVVLAAPRTGPKVEAYMRVLGELRSIGVAHRAHGRIDD